VLGRGHHQVTWQELFECIGRLLARETSKENRGQEILSVPKKYDYGVPGGTSWGNSECASS
jgi:hypothetical protein